MAFVCCQRCRDFRPCAVFVVSSGMSVGAGASALLPQRRTDGRQTTMIYIYGLNPQPGQQGTAATAMLPLVVCDRQREGSIFFSLINQHFSKRP